MRLDFLAPNLSIKEASEYRYLRELICDEQTNKQDRLKCLKWQSHCAGTTRVEVTGRTAWKGDSSSGYSRQTAMERRWGDVISHCAWSWDMGKITTKWSVFVENLKMGVEEIFFAWVSIYRSGLEVDFIACWGKLMQELSALSITLYDQNATSRVTRSNLRHKLDHACYIYTKW